MGYETGWLGNDSVMPANFIVVFDTYATSGFWPSTKVSYGHRHWPSFSHWVVYYKDLD